MRRYCTIISLLLICSFFKTFNPHKFQTNDTKKLRLAQKSAFQELFNDVSQVPKITNLKNL